MSAIFVTGTGTDIGKTFVCTGLIRHWRAAGHAVQALKPVATGFDPATAVDSDTGLLLAACGLPLDPANVDRISPCRFSAPLSPDMAARAEGRSVDFDALIDFCLHAIAGHRDTLLIEGIGGVMVPLDETHTVLDWMAMLNIPVVLVAGSYLGSLSHSLTALAALRSRKLAIKAVVLNETAGSTVSMSDTSDTLLRFVPGIPIVMLPRRGSSFAELASHL